MRRHLIPFAVLALIGGALAIAAVMYFNGTDDDAASDAHRQPELLAARRVEAGAVTVDITRAHIGADGAEFELTFDTHSVDLDFDVAAAARLTVDGVTRPPGTWTGTGPGGHHRQGTLRFDGAGQAPGVAGSGSTVCLPR
jgi:hypothetical protein